MRNSYRLVLSLLLLLVFGLASAETHAQTAAPAVQMQAASPNPFGSETQFAVQADQAGTVVVEVYNVLGQRVRTLLSERMEARESKVVRLDASGLPAGLYVIRAQAGGQVASQMVTLSR